MGSFGPLEIILIFLVVLLIFGAKRIPEIARGIGKGIREFKDATNEISQELESEAQSRQVNQPQAPQQGQPQARQPQQQTTSQQTSTDSDAASPGDAPAGESSSDAEQKNKKTETS
jgi:sec-independent protein translocase protein TatA